MSDWGNAFDEQCRSEGLEVPEKAEKLRSNSEMDHNEENKGLGSVGIGRGGMFGGGMKTNAPPPQTSFGATSGTRVGGSFGAPGGPDGRGAAIGSSEELNGGGNVISVGNHKERSACTLTRGGGFGTNRTTTTAPTTIKTNHEGGRFGVLSPRSFNSASNESVDQPKPPTGGRFGASQASMSRPSMGGMFGSKTSVSSPTTANPTFSFNTAKLESTPLPTSFGGSFGSSRSAVSNGGVATDGPSKPSIPTVDAYRNKVGGSFGTTIKNSPTTDASFETEPSVPVAKLNPSKTGGSFGRPVNSTVANGGSFGSKPSLPYDSAPVRPGGSFGSSITSPNTTGGAFGVKSSVPTNETRVTKAGGSFGSSIRSSTTTDGAFGAKINESTASEPYMAKAGGSFGSSVQSPTTTNDSAFAAKSSLPFNESHPVKTGGSFGSIKSSTTTVGSFSSTVRSSAPTGEFNEASSDDAKSNVVSRGGGFGSNVETSNENVPNRQFMDGSFGASKSGSGKSVGGAFGRKPANLQSINVPVPTVSKIETGRSKIDPSQYYGLDKPQTPEVRSSFGDSSRTMNNIIGSRTTGVADEMKIIGGSFSKPPPVINSNVSPFGRPPTNSSKPNEEKENEESATNSAQDTHSFGGSFGSKSTSSDKVTSNAEFGKEGEQNVPFMSGPPPTMRGGFQGGFRGGRGSGGHADFGGPGQGPMGRGRGQPNSSFVPQQRAPPQFASGPQQSVKPDPKYKYTKSTDTDPHEKVPVPADIALLNKFIQKEVKMMKDTVVDVQRQDPKSPLYSISSFRELRLKPEVLQALDNLNFQFPTRIQETALPLLLMEPPSNLIAQAQSGTGKTAAFVLTMLCRIDVNLKCPQCICLAPTLELAKQIGEVVEKMGRYMENLKIHYAIKGGNMAAMRGRKLTEQIVIGTPGITRDYLQKYKCIDPSQIRCLVLDEADVMIYHQGFTDISTTIYNMVEEASDSVQSMLFSATYDEPVINFATKIIKNAIVVMLKREEQALPNIKQFYVQCACRDSKYAAIVNLYSGLAVASSVIFCHTKASVMWLYENMKARGHKVDVLHGDMTVVERADTIIRFKRGDFKVLITTNVFARGIDVAQVSVVINYDLPIKYNEQDMPMVVDGFTQPDCETYLHRIGRTGRFGKTGIAINLIDSEDSMNMINVLENHFQMKIARMDPSNIVELEAIEMA